MKIDTKYVKKRIVKIIYEITIEISNEIWYKINSYMVSGIYSLIVCILNLHLFS